MRDSVIGDRAGGLQLRLDSRTGLLAGVALQTRAGEIAMPLGLSATLVTEGREVVAPPSGLGYADTVDLGDLRCVDPVPRFRTNGPEETYTISSRAGDWVVRWEYTFRGRHPRVELSVEVSPAYAGSPSTLRDLRLEVAARPGDLPSWRVEAPGNELRPAIAADALREPVEVSPPGGLRGSTGLVALHHPERRRTLVLWPFSRTEIGEVTLRSDEAALQLQVDCGLAGRIAPTETLRYGAIELDLLDRGWERTRDEIPTWYGPLGLGTPRDRPRWVETASIYEVQIGYSVFWGGYRYAPYPTARDLLADLDRIKGLGYDVLQIMPRQPYPSYNVHDYADITTSYGDEADLRRVVDTCHALGMRVICDILLHGVIDQEVMADTAARVRAGPYRDRLGEDTSGVWGAGPAARDAMAVAWSRHILDFEPYWHQGSPRRHPLADEHPEWFMRDSRQRVIGIYTKAFDVANARWQEYFCAAAESMVRRLDIDGFRFDAPTYNALPNWSTATERRASHSPLGSLRLFDRLRPRLKRIKDTVVLYTEPSGVAFRGPMDLTYNYDEQWLIPAVLRPTGDERARRTSVRSGRELAGWFRDRNAVLPDGSLTCHHVDSHDTFWWPLPGQKWRREQYGIPATRALLAVFALSGGAYMTFVGGEEGIEDEVRRVHRLRADLPELAWGTADYDAVAVDHEAVYAVARRGAEGCSVLLVNLSQRRLETACSIDDALCPPDDPPRVRDAWNDVDLDPDHVLTTPESRRIPVCFDAYQPRLLVLRPPK